MDAGYSENKLTHSHMSVMRVNHSIVPPEEAGMRRPIVEWPLHCGGKTLGWAREDRVT